MTRRVLSWVGSNVAAALTILGVVAYFAVTFSYRSFYGELGVDPEDVGIGYRKTLTDAAFAAIAILATAAAFLASWLVVGLVLLPVRLAWRRWIRHDRRPFSVKEAVTSDAGGFIVAVLLVLTFGLLPNRYASKAHDVRRGEPLQWESQVDFDNPFGLSAPPAAITWLTDSPPSIQIKGPLLYLGRSSGVVVLYDAGVDRVLRIPQGSAIIETGAPSPAERRTPRTRAARRQVKGKREGRTAARSGNASSRALRVNLQGVSEGLRLGSIERLDQGANALV